MPPRETRLLRHIDAPAHVVYELLLDPRAVSAWRVPDGMTSRVHAFQPHEGGAFRVSLTYAEPGPKGKSSESTDTYRGTFLRLVPNREVVERMRFETTDPAMRGWMTATYELRSTATGTELLAVHSGVPEGVSLRDNERGWSMALDKLALLAEARSRRPGSGAA